MHKEVEAFFDQAIKADFKDIQHDYHQTVEGGHGRVEVRRYWTVEGLQWLTQANKWSGLISVGIVESERPIEGKITTERRCFISSLSSNAKHFLITHNSQPDLATCLAWAGFSLQYKQNVETYFSNQSAY